MTRHCPTCTCGAHCDNADGKPRETVATLRAWCQERSLWVGLGDIVKEATAAALLDRKPGTRRNWLCGERPISFTRRRGGVVYALQEIADYLDGIQ